MLVCRIYSRQFTPAKLLHLFRERIHFIMSIGFGTTKDGKEALLYTISNQNGMSAEISNYGCAIVSLKVPAKDGKTLDVVLGYDNVSGYEDNPQCFGCCIGRNANRVGKASFNLNGKTYHLDANEGQNNLHSSLNDGYHKRIWDLISHSENAITFRMETPDGDQGYPGSCSTTVTYTLTDENEFCIRYDGVCSEETPWNVTNHSYFNLGGHDSGSIEDIVLWLNSTSYTPVDAESIPTGEIASTKGTPMDFSTPTAIGAHINDEFQQLKFTGGYDHNYCLDIEAGKLSLIARAYSPKTGVTMETYTDLPGVQFYAGNFIEAKEAMGKNGFIYKNRNGFCLETQYYPDSVNHNNFPSCIKKPGTNLNTVTIFKFC